MDRRLYLFKGETYTLVPESSWLTHLKQDPCGITVTKSIDDIFIEKSWVKVSQTVNDAGDYECIWLYTNSGEKLKVIVTKDGTVSANGQTIGQTSQGDDTFSKIEAMAGKPMLDKDGHHGKWATISSQGAGSAGKSHKVFIPDKAKGEEGAYLYGLDKGESLKSPESITKVEPMIPRQSSMNIALAQASGLYKIDNAILNSPLATKGKELLDLAKECHAKGDGTGAKEKAVEAFNVLRASNVGDEDEISRAVRDFLIELADGTKKAE